MSRHAMTPEEHVKFADKNPLAFSFAQGYHQRAYEISIATLFLLAPFILGMVFAVGRTTWATTGFIVLAVIAALAVTVCILSSRKLAYYDDIDSRRVHAISERLKGMLAEPDDEGLAALAERRMGVLHKTKD